MKPYISLGTFKPSKWRASIIGKELTEFTRQRGLRPFLNDEIQRNERAIWKDWALHAEVRRTAVIGSEGTSFHQDGDTSTSNMDCALVLWSNKWPTQFRGNDGVVYQCKPFEVVIARNLACTHRRPPEADGKRWSFRQRVAVPASLRLP